MSFLKNIMSPFLEFKGEEKKPEGREETLQNKAAKSYELTTADSDRSIESSPSGSRTTATSDYHKYFDDLVEQANAKNPLFQGTDFKEFIDSKVDVEAIADEATRYKTAFNVLKRTGLTKDKLVSTGHEYLHIIERDLKGFEEAYTQQYKKEVEQNEILLQVKAGELQQLNEKISVLSQEIKKVSLEITKSKDQLNTNKEAFLNAGHDKKKEIETELQKINQYF